MKKEKRLLSIVSILSFSVINVFSQQIDTLWIEYFEGDWQSDWHADYGIWDVDTITYGPDSAYAGIQCLATNPVGEYPNNVNSRFIRHKSFVVPSASENPRLRFWHWFEFSSNTSGDYGIVQIREQGTTDWENISGSYYYSSSGIWSCPYIDLSDYENKTVELAFYCKSNEGWGRGPGWYIDNVCLEKGYIRFNNPTLWETGLADWNPESGTWEVGTPKSGPNEAYSAPNCVATALNKDYSNNVSSRLISPPFIIPSADMNPRLRFWHWFEFSCDTRGDYGIVQLKETNQNEWIDISNKYMCSSSSAWTYPLIDLSEYVDKEVQFAFYMISNEGWSRGPGWYIDNISVVEGDIVIHDTTNWEDGIGDWSVDAGTWEIGIPTIGPSEAHSPPNCAGTYLSGNYSNNVSSRLVSPTFIVPNKETNPRLRFWHWYSFSDDTEGDYGQVQIKKVGDINWSDLPECHYLKTSDGKWTQPYIRLSDYADSTVQISFYLKSNEGWGRGSGWYIDDITLEKDESSGLIYSNEITIPKSMALFQNYPNPFNPITTIKYYLPKSSRVRIDIYNILGQKVARLINKYKPVGMHELTFNASNLASGVYIYRLTIDIGFSKTKKMILIR